LPTADYEADQLKHVGGLLRINHTGEVCAQALYQGQAALASTPSVREDLLAAAEEELDHLAWCEQRISELDTHTSYLNPLFYGASFVIGAAAALAGDKFSLGFVAATEDQVCKHLESHLEQMLIDEREPGEHALAAGGEEFSSARKQPMTLLSKAMTSTTYYI
jgi:ubiquinone biosynthesis monooxygenase Coq7